MSDSNFNGQKYVGQSVIVTGGGSGIGLACAKSFAKRGASVVILGRTAARLETAVDELRSTNDQATHTYVAGDVADETVVSEAVKRAGELAPIRIAIANAGMGGLSPVIATEADHFDDIMRTNLRGTFLISCKNTPSHCGAV